MEILRIIAGLLAVPILSLGLLIEKNNKKCPKIIIYLGKILGEFHLGKNI